MKNFVIQLPIDEAKAGDVRKLLVMTCGVCHESEVVEFTEGSSIKVIEDLTDREWRVSANHGYIHRKCEKRMPSVIKFGP